MLVVYVLVFTCVAFFIDAFEYEGFDSTAAVLGIFFLFDAIVWLKVLQG